MISDALFFYISGTSDLVPVGGSINVRLPRSEYDHIQASSKPSSMVLRLLDKLFTKETLLKSTLYGTKEFAALDSTKIAAIKGKLGKGTTKSPSRCSFNLSFNLTLIKPEVVCVQCLTGDFFL